jgi:hypothetical protein
MSSRPCCSNGRRERSPPSFAPKMVVSFKNRGAVVSFKNRGAHVTCPRARHRCAILRYSPVPSWSDIPTAVSSRATSATGCRTGFARSSISTPSFPRTAKPFSTTPRPRTQARQRLGNLGNRPTSQFFQIERRKGTRCIGVSDRWDDGGGIARDDYLIATDLPFRNPPPASQSVLCRRVVRQL